jgi:hypothetical protein
MTTAPLPQPFQWGAAGKRMTPEEIAQSRKVAMALSAPDFSPVASPWQGLARVAGQVSGALQSRRADRAAETNAAESSRVLEALLAGDGTDKTALTNAAFNPYLDEGARKFAGTQLAALAKPAPVNDTVADYEFRTQMLGKDAADAWLARGNDPFVTASLPGGQFYAGPQSGFASALGVGAQPVAAPQAAQPTTKRLSNGQMAYLVNGEWYDNPEGR